MQLSKIPAIQQLTGDWTAAALGPASTLILMSSLQTFKSNVHFFKTGNPQCWKPACVCERVVRGDAGNDCVPKSLFWESESEFFISPKVKFFESCFFSLHSLNLVSFLMWFIGFKKIMCLCIRPCKRACLRLAITLSRFKMITEVQNRHKNAIARRLESKRYIRDKGSLYRTK